MSLAKSFGDRLKNARKNKGLSQKDVAKAVKKHYHRIIAYEEGRVTLDMVEKLASAVGKTPWDLIKPSEDDLSPAAPKEPGNAELLEAMTKLQARIKDLEAELAHMRSLYEPTEAELEDARRAADALPNDDLEPYSEALPPKKTKA